MTGGADDPLATTRHAQWRSPSPILLLDRYQVIAVLGRGGFGTVVRAFDPLIKRSVAIKTLNPGLAVQYPDAFTNLRERFVRAAEAGLTSYVPIQRKAVRKMSVLWPYIEPA